MEPFNSQFNDRKYTCFVCGQIFDQYKPFQEHILSTHDEGREFVKCPLKRCQACVRDIRSHFKFAHPSEPIPKSMQMKALIWKNFNPNTKKAKVKKHFKEGFYESKKNGEKIHYRSGLECEYYKVLEAMNEVSSYKAEAFEIEYFFEGGMKRYFPDILVIYKDGRREVWEIKPANQQKLPKNQAKWLAAQKFCENRNMPFIVYTEKGLKDLQRKINNRPKDE
jgi:hypothetical protein